MLASAPVCLPICILMVFMGLCPSTSMCHWTLGTLSFMEGSMASTCTTDFSVAKIDVHSIRIDSKNVIFAK